jgi:hypothetical protein
LCAQAAFLELSGLAHLLWAALDPASDAADAAGSAGATWCDGAAASVWALRGKALALALDFLDEEKAAAADAAAGAASAGAVPAALEALAREATGPGWRRVASAGLGAGCRAGRGPPLKVTETALQLVAAQWGRARGAATSSAGALAAVPVQAPATTAAAVAAAAALPAEAELLRGSASALAQKFARLAAASASESDELEGGDEASSEYAAELQAHAEAALAALGVAA